MVDTLEYIPWLISAGSLLIALLSFVRNTHKDDISLKEGILKANMKLDQVCATTNETRSDIKSLNRDLKDVETRVTILERDLKTAFTEIHELKGVHHES